MRSSTWRLRGRVLLALLVTALIATGTSAPASADRRSGKAPRVPGMVLVESGQSFEATWSALIGAIEANPNIKLVAVIDHGAAAETIGAELAPNRVAVFGNPALGSPLMQRNQVAGIDLPQKIQVFERRGRVWVGFNDAAYLAARHRLGSLPTLETIAAALRTLAGTAADETVDARTGGLRWVRRHPGLVTRASDVDVDQTWNRLLAAIDASPATVAFTVDHQKNAAAAGLALRPTRLVAFGNPQLGTPLMQQRPTAGIDLPVKFLVWQDADGVTQVTTNGLELARRHGLRRADLGPITSAVETFLTKATTST